MSEKLESGIGWSWDEASRTSTYYFELTGASTDAEGNDSEAGCQLRFEQCGKKVSVKKREAFVASIEKDGLHGYPARAITVEEYDEKYNY